VKVGILGYGGVGRTTLFSVLTGQEVVARAPGETHLASVEVLDPRLDHLRDVWKPKKFTRARFDVEDPPPIPAGDASDRETRVAALRHADAYLLVIGAFEQAAMALGEKLADPHAQLRTMVEELALLDLEALDKRISKAEERLKKGQGDRAALTKDVEHMKRIQAHVESGRSPRELVDGDARRLLHELELFQDKPQVAVFNVDEAQLTDAARVEKLRAAGAPRCAVLCAPIEKEIAALEGADRAAFLKEYGLAEPAAPLLTRLAYESLDLISFFTMGNDEVRAWPITRGSNAVTAAGRIHSDLARGFIRAEVIPYARIAAAKDEKELKSLSKPDLVGKEHVVQDGDVLNIRFSV
jgi:ribosome-binding ATPase YchF (GTP1/OBG family)